MTSQVFSDTPPWEKLIGFTGFMLILSMLCYLAWAAYSIGDSPPRIEFEITDIQKGQDDYLVLVVIRNSGEQVAMSLNVEASLKLMDGSMEHSATSIDYLPVESDYELGFYFRNDPVAGELSFRALNFQVP